MAGTSAQVGLLISTARTNTGSAEIISVTDSTISTLNAPSDANVAEISIHDNIEAVIFRTDGGVPTNAPVVGHAAFQRIELESTDEVSEFRAIALVGQPVRLYVEYKNDPNLGNN